MKINLNFSPNISINKILSKLPYLTNICGLLAIIFMASKSIWWISKPESTNYLTQSNTLMSDDKLVQQLINLAPFGVVQKEIESQQEVSKPKDKITIYGIYASDSKNSIALAKVNDKDIVIQIGDDFADGKVTKILNNKVIVLVDNHEITYPINENPTQDNNDSVSNFANNNYHGIDNNNQHNDDGKIQSNDPQINNLAEQRRKMIKQLQEENSNNDSNNNTPNTDNNNVQQN